MKKVYLACPYSHTDKKVREWRVEQVDKKAAELMMAGNLVFSPLSHSHPVSKHCDVDPCAHDFWMNQDLWILEICDEFHILCLKGWDRSRGVDTELKRAQGLGLKIVFHV